MAFNQATSSGYPPKIQLLAAATATGAWLHWPGGRGQCHAIASNWNGSTMSLQRRALDESTALDIGADVIFTADDLGNFECPPCDLRAEVTVAVPTGMSVWVERIEP